MSASRDFAFLHREILHQIYTHSGLSSKLSLFNLNYDVVALNKKGSLRKYDLRREFVD